MTWGCGICALCWPTEFTFKCFCVDICCWIQC